MTPGNPTIPNILKEHEEIAKVGQVKSIFPFTPCSDGKSFGVDSAGC